MKLTYRHTAIGCCIGMITQAIVCNLAPILFIIFKENYFLTDEQLGRLIVFNFGTQIVESAVSVSVRKLIIAAFSMGIIAMLFIGFSVSLKLLKHKYQNEKIIVEKTE